MNNKKKILVIDDSNTTLLLLEWAFKGEGYDVLIAESVGEAMKILQQNKPDLVLLDLSMPDVSGYDFLKMKPELNLTDVPVLVVSAFDSQESVKQTKELGAAEFIPKPFVVAKILKTAKKYLG
jgi:DNA-binding response OmpR family regulator